MAIGTSTGERYDDQISHEIGMLTPKDRIEDTFTAVQDAVGTGEFDPQGNNWSETFRPQKPVIQTPEPMGAIKLAGDPPTSDTNNNVIKSGVGEVGPNNKNWRGYKLYPDLWDGLSESLHGHGDSDKRPIRLRHSPGIYWPEDTKNIAGDLPTSDTKERTSEAPNASLDPSNEGDTFAQRFGNWKYANSFAPHSSEDTSGKQMFSYPEGHEGRPQQIADKFVGFPYPEVAQFFNKNPDIWDKFIADNPPSKNIEDRATQVQEANMAEGARNVAARRMEMSAAPEGGRQEGRTTKFLDRYLGHVAEGIKELVKMPTEYAQSFKPGQEVDAATAEWGAAVALQLTTAGIAAAPFKPGVGLFGGRMSPKAVEVAENMEKNKYPEITIKEITGLERGADGEWRLEFSDKLASYHPENFGIDARSGADVAKLGDVFKHDKLYEAYPAAKNIRVVENSSIKATAEYDPNLNMIILKDKTALTTRGDILHEVQHWIQDREGFSLGHESYISQKKIDQIKGQYLRKYSKDEVEQIFDLLDMKRDSPLSDSTRIEVAKIAAKRLLDDADFAVYARMAHEVEARNVTKRSYLSEKEIDRSLGKDTEDYPRFDQVVFKGKLLGQEVQTGSHYSLEPVGNDKTGVKMGKPDLLEKADTFNKIANEQRKPGWDEADPGFHILRTGKTDVSGQFGYVRRIGGTEDFQAFQTHVKGSRIEDFLPGEGFAKPIGPQVKTLKEAKTILEMQAKKDSQRSK